MNDQLSATPGDIPRLFDIAALCRHRARAAAGYAGFDFLKAEAAIRLADRLDLMRRDFPLCLDVGCHDGTLTRHIRETGKVGTVIQADIVPAFATQARNEGPPVVLDVEALPFASHSCDAVFSCLMLHWVDDLPGLMTQFRRLLKPDGLLLVNLLGGYNAWRVARGASRSRNGHLWRCRPPHGTDG